MLINSMTTSINWFNTSTTIHTSITPQWNIRCCQVTPQYLFTHWSCKEYFDAVYQTQTQFPSYTEDFFPLLTGDFDWWTGYYTSRPAYKKYIRYYSHINSQSLTLTWRESGAVLRTTETLYTLALPLLSKYSLNADTLFNGIDIMRQAMAISQHHDAIT
jgi:hypothetical protein